MFRAWEPEGSAGASIDSSRMALTCLQSLGTEMESVTQEFPSV